MILPSDYEGAETEPSAAMPMEDLFPSGAVMTTPAALKALTLPDMANALNRHLRGDWGDLCDEDKAENEFSLTKGFRLFSVYHTAEGTKFYIITEADRSVTTILLPSDY